MGKLFFTPLYKISEDSFIQTSVYFLEHLTHLMLLVKLTFLFLLIIYFIFILCHFHCLKFIVLLLF